MVGVDFGICRLLAVVLLIISVNINADITIIVLEMLSALEIYDHQLFHWVNTTMGHPWLDEVLPWMRDSEVWVPAYILLLIFMIYRYRWEGLAWVLTCGATVGLADVMSSHVIKPLIHRARPCHEAAEVGDMILRVSCGPGYSFTSSHATNHTALAMFIILSTAMWSWGRWRWLLLFWALTIGYAQVYVGVHFPFDVLCGTLLGGLIGSSSAWAYQLWIHGRWAPKA